MTIVPHPALDFQSQNTGSRLNNQRRLGTTGRREASVDYQLAQWIPSVPDHPGALPLRAPTSPARRDQEDDGELGAT